MTGTNSNGKTKKVERRVCWSCLVFDNEDDFIHLDRCPQCNGALKMVRGQDCPSCGRFVTGELITNSDRVGCAECCNE